jgi:hypothetical protein
VEYHPHHGIFDELESENIQVHDTFQKPIVVRPLMETPLVVLQVVVILVQQQRALFQLPGFLFVLCLVLQVVVVTVTLN